MSALRFLLLLTSALVLGPWNATTQASPATIEVENGSRDCAGVAPECFVTTEPGGEGIGDDEVNITQDLRRVNAGLYVGAMPGQGVAVDAQDIRVDHNLTSSTREAWEGNGASPAPSVVNVTINESGVHLYRPSAKAKELDRGLRSDKDTIGFTERGVGYDRLGPYHDLGGTSTDDLIAQAGGFCYGAERELCEDVHENASNITEEQLPSVGVGVSVGEFGAGIGNVGTKGNQTSGSGGSLGRMPHRDLGGARRHDPPPLAHQDPQANAQDTSSGTFAPHSVDGVTPARTAPPPVESSNERAWLKLAAAGVLATLLLIAAGLYARLRQEKEILTSRTRQVVLEAVRAQPGVRLAALARSLDMRRSALLHHLDIMERARLIKTTREGHTVSVFPGGVQPPPRFDLQSHPVCRQVLRSLARSPGGLTRGELRQLAPDVAERTLNYNVRRLQEAGLVAVRGAGRSTRLLLNRAA